MKEIPKASLNRKVSAKPAPVIWSETCHAGLQNGQDREALIRDLPPLEGSPGFVDAGNGERHAVYNQDATIAVCDVPDDAEPVGHIIEGLSEQFSSKSDSAAISLAYIEDSPDQEGAIRINAACAGDCDIYVVITDQDTGEARIQRCFDEVDFPDEFDATDTASRKLSDHIGGQLDGATRTQTLDIPLKPNEQMSVFAASDGLWDGHIAVNCHQGILSQDTPHDVYTGVMKARILQHVTQAITQEGPQNIASSLINNLMNDVQTSARTPNENFTDNLSVSALTIQGGAPLNQKCMLGSIDGAGNVGPTEQMVQDMRRIAIERSKGQVVTPSLAQQAKQAPSPPQAKQSVNTRP